MTQTRIRRACTAALLVALLGRVAPAHAGEVAAQLRAVEHLLSQWRIHEASQQAQQLYKQLPDVPAVQAAAGRVKFYQSDYAGAVTLLEKAAQAFQGGAQGAADSAWESDLLALARATRDATRGYVATESAHFSFRAPPGKDVILASYALEALEAAYSRIGGDLDWHPTEKIVVEVYPTARSLAQVSTLTENEIQTSGTIAICKFNRLMFTSPRALVHGYPWLDTLAHEFTHLLISQKSHNTVGIWLHEGLAKYSETRWRGEAGEALGPWQENLLARGIQKGTLITFEQMHPSMAKLPSQKDTALAFAEVFTVVEYLHAGGPACAGQAHCPKGVATGYAVTNAILTHLRDGRSDEEAVAAVLGTSFETFKKDWMRWLRARPRRTSLAQAPDLKFRKGGLDDEDREQDVDDGLPTEVQRAARLGGLLRNAGRPKAAAMQYERAVAKAGRVSPVLHNRLASVLLEAGEDERALATLQSIMNTFPDHGQTWVQMGRIHFKHKAWAKAEQAYRVANRVNPFNLEIHAALANVLEQQGQTKGAEAEAAIYRTLVGHVVEGGGSSLVDDPREPHAVLKVETHPWAQLIVDDSDLGLMTPVEIRITPGPHTLRIRNPALGVDRTVAVEARAGEHPTVRMDLAP